MSGRHTLPDGTSHGRDEFDALYSALSNEPSRQVLRYFQSTDEAVATHDDLVDYAMAETESVDERDRLAIRLHHAALPRLDACGFVDYHPQRRLVEYRDSPAMERVLGLVGEFEASG